MTAVLESSPIVNPDEARESRVLIIFPGALGDLICLLPTIRWIASQNPQAAIELMARMELARFAVGRMGVARAHSVDRPEVSRLFVDSDIDLSSAREFFNAFDRIYSFFAAENERFIVNLAASSREVQFYPFRPPGEGHIAEAYLAAVGAPDGFDGGAKIELLEADQVAASEILESFRLERGEYLLVLPGSGSRTKNWPVEKFVELTQRLAEKIKPLALLGPAEEGIADAFYATRVSVLGDLELGTVAALASRARAFIGNDSGVSHLAAASGAGGLVLFGPTDPDRWRPKGRIEVIRHQPLADLAVSDVEVALSAIVRRPK